MDELILLEEKKNRLLKAKMDSERKKKLKQEIFQLEHPVQARVGNAVLNMFKPRAGETTARKAKLKKKVATVSDVNKALDGLMRM